MMGITGSELIMCLSMLFGIVWMLILLLELSTYKADTSDFRRGMDEKEPDWETANVILQAYLDGLEKGLSLLRQSGYDLFDDIDDNDEKDGE